MIWSKNQRHQSGHTPPRGILMQERRVKPRHRTLKAGTIAFNRAAGISCMVRNLSPIGACLEVESLVGVPEAFTLVVESDHVNQPCHIIWRKEKRIGVAFD
jgi:hypothetical protein